MKKYGNALKYQRQLNGYTQSALSKATGIKQPMISWWEAEKGLPNIDFCVQLAKFYGITLDELLGLDESPTTISIKHTEPNLFTEKNKMNFLEIFKELKEENGLSITEISKKTGIPIPTLSNYLNRGSLPGVEQLILLAKFFNVSVDYLVGLEEDSPATVSIKFPAPALSEEEKELLKLFKILPKDEQNAVLTIIRNTVTLKKRNLNK